MRPYVAIIKDSFREALASRVLWVLLLMITVLMIALIPFHWRSTIAADMTKLDVRNVGNLATLLKSGGDEEAAPLIRHVWDSLSESTRKRIRELRNSRDPRNFIVRDRLVDDFNEIIEKEDFFDAALWEEATLPERAEELLQQGNLAGVERKQFNRLALEAALPGQLRPCPDEAVMFRYANWDLEFVPSLRRSSAIEIMDTFVMGFMAIFVGFFGIFAGVLVTAPIIPNMLNSGSLYVLLSKPVSRPLTFIAKFVGGCSFVLINAAYLVVGLWLLLGFRFGVWKPTLLWSIPIFLFSFAIFYSVSALSGLVWRNTVMAIAATIVFWFCCKAVAITKEGIEQLAVVPDRITQIATHDDELFVNRRSGGMAVWNAETGSLEEIMASKVAPQGAEMMMGGRNPFSGFHYDADEGRLIALDRNWNRSKLITGRRENGFKREQEIAGPRNARGLFAVDGQLLTVGNGGIYVLSIPEPKDASADIAADEKVNDETDEPKAINIFGLKLGGKKPEKPEDPFQRISDDIGPLSGDARVAFDESNADLFIHGGRTLKRYGRSDGFYTGKKNCGTEGTEGGPQCPGRWRNRCHRLTKG